MDKADDFTLYKGFDSLEEAKDYLCNDLWFSTIEGFSFIRVSDQNVSYIYPVAMENLDLQIIITKEKCWYRNRLSAFSYSRYSEIANNGKLFDSDSPDMNEFQVVGETFEAIKPRISRKWDDLYKRKLEEKCDVECVYTGNLINPKSYVVFDSIILLSTLFFNMIGKNIKLREFW